MDWDLRHIRCLVAVAEAGSITDAALELGISQPQASRTLKALETAWGVKLVSRSTRDTVLTAEGLRASDQGRHLLAFAQSIADAAGGARIIRLGYVSTAAGRHTPAVQRRWRQARPDVDLRLIHGKGPLAGMGEGLCDAAVLRREPDPAKYSSVVVGTEPLVAACADNDLWGRRRRLRLEDFAGRPLVVNVQSDLRVMPWPSGVGPVPAFDVDSVDAWLDLIAAGRGVGITTEATAHQHRPIGVRYLPVTDAPHVEVRLSWPRGQGISGLGVLQEILQDLYSR
ncbi:LysR family transcriptional regulator [Nesterenkonia muleiensis]|uniref:LysR family transcriptional regulator n=1 Tax=Nesterenkonia muleiensis TaxID=2282648 RepID=UPI000E71C485|nr:LysR family transcriptional regulator [Nesterenkonia muleiensis]